MIRKLVLMLLSLLSVIPIGLWMLEPYDFGSEVWDLTEAVSIYRSVGQGRCRIDIFHSLDEAIDSTRLRYDFVGVDFHENRRMLQRGLADALKKRFRDERKRGPTPPTTLGFAWSWASPVTSGGRAIISHRIIVFPLWAPSLLFATCPAIALIGFIRGSVRRWRRRRKGWCLACGYNLQGNVSGVCPECGEPSGRGATHGP